MQKQTHGSVDWDRVSEGLERAGHRMIWKPYGLPAVGSARQSAFFAGDVSPAWDVPEEIMVSVGLTGALFRPEDNPAQPITTAQLLDEARACVREGATMIHLHVRDEHGYNTLSQKLFAEVVEPLKAEFPQLSVDGCLVCALEGEWEEMKSVIASGLFDAVPINTAATYIGDSLFAKPVPVILEKTRLTLEAGMRPLIACYTDGDISNAERYLFQSGLLDSGQSWLLLPALPGCSRMSGPEEMMYVLLRQAAAVRDVDPDATIFVCAAGRASSYLVTAATLLGLNIRVGMEDTVWRHPHREELLDSNVSAFRAAKQMAELLGRPVMSHQDYTSRQRT